jgi:hypothetical protein
MCHWIASFGSAPFLTLQHSSWIVCLLLLPSAEVATASTCCSANLQMRADVKGNAMTSVSHRVATAFHLLSTRVLYGDPALELWRNVA